MQTFFCIARIRLSHSLCLLGFVIIFLGCSTREKQQEEADLIAAPEKKGEWKLLFDGKTTAGWRGINQEVFPADGWEVADSMLMVNATDGKESGNGGDIITTEEYSNFVLEWEWKMLTKGGNSGIKYFVKEGLSGNKKYGAGLEYQILDDANHEWMLAGKMKPGDFHTMAALYEIYPAESRPVKPLGEWNHSRIVVEGNHVEHWLNGVKVLVYERGSEDFKKKVAESKFAQYENFGEAAEGHILIQDHGSKMAFRNIRIKES